MTHTEYDTREERHVRRNGQIWVLDRYGNKIRQTHDYAIEGTVNGEEWLHILYIKWHKPTKADAKGILYWQWLQVRGNELLGYSRDHAYTTDEVPGATEAVVTVKRITIND